MKAVTTTTHHVSFAFPISPMVRIDSNYVGIPSNYSVWISADGPEMIPLLIELRRIANTILNELNGAEEELPS